VSAITRAIQFHAVFMPTSMVRVSDGTRQSLDVARGSTCVAFCGIARPGPFRQMLEEFGLTLKEFQEFPDHHRYTKRDLEFLENIIRQISPEFVLTTEKDAVRLMDDSAQLFRQHYPLYYVELEARITDGSHFSELLDKAANQQ